MRLDAYLAQHWPETSRSTWQKYCKSGYIKVNGHVVTSTDKILDEDDHVTFDLPPAQDYSAQELPVLYEDDDVIVINKPAGILTHAKGVITDEFSVGEFMRSRTTDGADTNRPGIVHRLDRDTSGIIITAKNAESKKWLQKQFAQRRLKKTYIALVVGQPKEPTAQLDLPIERNPKKPQTFRVSANGKSAQTIYKTLQNFKDFTLLELKPTTGRTHQLRVHLAYLNCPIVGDRVYGKTNAKLGRMFLHASELELTLPSRTRKTFNAPLPPELQDFLSSLKP